MIPIAWHIPSARAEWGIRDRESAVVYMAMRTDSLVGYTSVTVYMKRNRIPSDLGSTSVVIGTIRLELFDIGIKASW